MNEKYYECWNAERKIKERIYIIMIGQLTKNKGKILLRRGGGKMKERKNKKKKIRGRMRER